MTNSSGSAGRSAEDIARAKREKAERLQRQAENYEKGAAAERHVAGILDTLPSEYFVLHDLSIPGSKANIDHLVIGPAGVWAIDTKAYAGQLTAGRDMLWRGRIPIRKECETAQWEAGQIALWLGHPVYTALCFVGTVLPAPVTWLGAVAVCPSDVMVPLLLSLPRVQIEPARMFEMFDRASRLVRDPSSIRRPEMRAPSPPPVPLTSIPVPPPPPPPVPMATLPQKPPRPPKQPKEPKPPKQRESPLVARGALLQLLAALLFLLGVLAFGPRITKLVSEWFADSVEESMPPSPTTSTATTSIAAVTDTWPTVTLVCPAPSQHWTATLAPSTDAPDSVGFYVWYRLKPDGQFFKWGHFVPDTLALPDIGNIQPGAQFSVRFDRADLADGSTAAGGVDLSAGPDC